MDQTDFYDIDGHCILVRKPLPESKWYMMTGPFQVQVWMSLMVTIAVVGVFLRYARMFADDVTSYFETIQFLYGTIWMRGGLKLQSR